MKLELARGIALIAGLSMTAFGQTGRISGIVTDSAGRAMVNAEVVATPGAHRTRSDSAGRYVLNGLPPGRYRLHARKFGYAPAESDAQISGDAQLQMNLQLGARLALIDTVFVRADGHCSDRSLDGFVCRKKEGKGLFLDYTDIDDKNVTYPADLFRDIDGFRVDVRSGPRGPVRFVESMTGWRCLVTLVDGHPPTPATPAPQYADEIVAMEIYADSKTVPIEYQRYYWPRGSGRPGGPCSLVVYWTERAPTRP